MGVQVFAQMLLKGRLFASVAFETAREHVVPVRLPAVFDCMYPDCNVFFNTLINATI
jgi:hypothetical protein